MLKLIGIHQKDWSPSLVIYTNIYTQENKVSPQKPTEWDNLLYYMSYCRPIPSKSSHSATTNLWRIAMYNILHHRAVLMF